MTLHHDIKKILHNQEAIMADFSKLNSDLADLNAKIDALLAKSAPPPPADDQPAVDAADAAVQAIAAKIPA